MSSGRLQQMFEHALNEAFDALERRDWPRLASEAQIALALEPTSEEARRLAEVAATQTAAARGSTDAAATQPPQATAPVSAAGPLPPPAASSPGAPEHHPVVIDSLHGEAQDAVAAPPARAARRPVRRSAATLTGIADHVADLVPFPATATQVIQLSDDETSTIDQMARLIAADPALTAKILRTANSAYYHRGQRITTIREALVVLGAREIRSLTVATCVIDSLGESYVVSSDEFWRFSLTVALLAELLARSERIINGDAFTVGILHGIGLLALDLYWPDGLQEVLTIDDPQLRRLHDRERAVFGFTDAEVGAMLAERWRLPRPIVQAIANQGLRLDELEPGDKLSSHLIRSRIFARFNGLSDGLEQSDPRTPPDEWLQPPLATSLHRMGGLEGILRRVDAFLGAAHEVNPHVRAA